MLYTEPVFITKNGKGDIAEFPEKFRLVDDPVLASWSIRFVIVND